MTVVGIDPASQEASISPDDAELVRRVAQKDRDALKELYDRHVGWVTTRLHRRCRDADMVDSAVQDTFLAVWNQAKTYRPTGEVGAWIWTIAIRRLIDQLRKRPPPQPVDDPELLVDVLSFEVPLALGHTDLGAAFASLDHELQVVMALTALDGLTNREAAMLLGVPTGTVKSRLSRARSNLQEVLR